MTLIQIALVMLLYNTSVDLYFYNYFDNNTLIFNGCCFEGIMLTDTIVWNLKPSYSQNFIFTDSITYPSYTSGQCSYIIPSQNNIVYFQWYKDDNTHQYYYGITNHADYNTKLYISRNNTNYYIYDL